MKLSFNEGTTWESASLEENLELCEKYGYDYIEIREIDQLVDYLEDHTLADLKEWFDTHHLKPLSLNALCFFNNRSAEDEKAIMEEFQKYLAICKAIGCEYIVAVPSHLEHTATGKPSRKEIEDSAVKVLREFSKMAEPYDVKVAVEFIGVPTDTINTFAQAYEIVKKVDRDNIGLIYDTFQFTGMGSRMEDVIDEVKEKIFIFHINDVDDLIVGHMTDVDRVWPGEGIIDLDAHIKRLKELDYDFVTSVELFRPEYYQMDPDYVVKHARDTTLAVLKRNGIKI
ncbi:sugar phosphate isomerase/epimerase family protein [Enterococcus faecium]|uniref:sugar phosphate isomerase/epimerase family protein n=1 Tax=Enterococcus faecium TaxID=1352 RepID=UPI00339061DE